MSDPYAPGSGGGSSGTVRNPYQDDSGDSSESNSGPDGGDSGGAGGDGSDAPSPDNQLDDSAQSDLEQGEDPYAPGSGGGSSGSVQNPYQDDTGSSGGGGGETGGSSSGSDSGGSSGSDNLDESAEDDIEQGEDPYAPGSGGGSSGSVQNPYEDGSDGGGGSGEGSSGGGDSGSPTPDGDRIDIGPQEVTRIDRGEAVSTVAESEVRSNLREFAASEYDDYSADDISVQRTDSGDYQATAGGQVIAESTDVASTIESQVEEQVGADVAVERQGDQYRAVFADADAQSEWLEQNIASSNEDITAGEVTVEQQGDEVVASITGEGIVRATDPDELRDQLATDSLSRSGPGGPSRPGQQASPPGYEESDFYIDRSAGEVYVREGAQERLTRESAAFNLGVSEAAIDVERQGGEFVATQTVPVDTTQTGSGGDLTPAEDGPGLGQESASGEQIERAETVRDRSATETLTYEAGQVRDAVESQSQVREDLEGGIEDLKSTASGSQQAALTAAGAGVATPEPVSTGTGLAVGGIIATALAADAARDAEIGIPSNQRQQSEIQTPQNQRRQTEIDTPTGAGAGTAEVGIGETVVSSEIDATDQTTPGSEIDITQTSAIVDQPTDGGTITPEEPSINDTGPEVDETSNDYQREREFPTGEDAVVGRGTGDETASEVADETAPVGGELGEIEPGVGQGVGSGSGIGNQPLPVTSPEAAADAEARPGLGQGVGTMTGIGNAAMGLAAPQSVAAATGQPNAFENQFEYGYQYEYEYQNEFGQGSPPQRPRFPDSSGFGSESPGGDEVGLGSLGGGGDDQLATGWLSETVTDIGTGGRELPGTPSEGQLEDQAASLQATGELPTSQLLSGDESVEDARALLDPADDGFGFGDDRDGGGLL